MRFIHSSDLQIGMVFKYFEPAAEALLQDARQGAVRILGELAVRHAAAAVLLAGDIYDKQLLSPQALAKPIEAMRRFPGVAWHLMPGNHDHARENGLWQRLRRQGLPENVHLHTDRGAVKIADDNGASVFLLPAPLRYLASSEDLTAYMDAEPTPGGAVRIGIAHGSIQNFGADGENRNYIAPDRAKTAGLAYLALGDWHRQMSINERTWYSGTPEPDQFRLPPDAGETLCNGGSALLVEISGARAIPIVRPVETGKYRWHQVSATLTDNSHIDFLAARLRGLDADLGRVVLDLRVKGVLSLASRKRFEDAIVDSGIGAAVCVMRADRSGLVLEPTEADLDDIDRPGGFVRDAAERLEAMARDPAAGERARLASLALRRLYLEHLTMADR